MVTLYLHFVLEKSIKMWYNKTLRNGLRPFLKSVEYCAQRKTLMSEAQLLSSSLLNIARSAIFTVWRMDLRNKPYGYYPQEGNIWLEKDRDE
ncbi:MAG: hypothetical protein LUH43_08035 [Clostridia bacterium]|nr:hypothetical protein [Clostridia bacterium]